MKGLISLVIPTFNVARYLPDFLSSLERQRVDLADLDIVFVDDGSTDESGQILKEWVHSTAPSARIITKSNGGLCSARNAGLPHVTGTWVNFCDPDDMLPPDYFEIVTRFLESDAAERVHLVSCNLQVLEDATGEIRNDHPLRFKFAKGNQIVELDRHPQYIHLQAASAFYRIELIEKMGLTFDHLVQPNFEDGYFTTLYLAGQDRPALALLADAHYHYRHRDDGSSLVQSSWTVEAKYTQVTRHGYLRLLRSVHDRLGHIPIWVQNVVLYDLCWYFKTDERIHSTIGAVPRDVTAEFHEIVGEIMSYIDLETIEDFRLTPMSAEIRNALIIGFKGEKVRPREVHVARIDADKQIAQIRYFYGGDLPREEFRARGHRVMPVHAKIRSITYLGERMASERIVWLPATGTLSVALDGRRKPIAINSVGQPAYSATPGEMWRRLTTQPEPVDRTPRSSTGAVDVDPGADSRAGSLVPRRAIQLKRRLKLRTRWRRLVGQKRWSPAWPNVASRSLRTRGLDRLTRRAASSRVLKLRFGDAWVFTDRDNMAQDNAEHLYRHVRATHPEANAWFVIDRDSEDWDRLAADGFRLVSYGTRHHALLMRNCKHLISSQVDHYVVQPLNPKRFGRSSGRFTFLQHGVTKDDLSRWVNGKPISLFVTATEPEFASIAGDHTPYVFTTKETRLTGFPRHDRLLALAKARRPDDSKTLLVMPTWRRELLGETIGAGGNTRQVLPGFWETDYAQQWTAVVGSERLRQLAAAAGLTITFVPHPNMQDYIDATSFPRHVEVVRYRDVDIQETFANGALLVTDYSSNAFEMAYIERPVVYFQFDRTAFFSGGHAYRQGTWSYDDDAFGPVALTATSTLDEVERLIVGGLRPSPHHLERMRQSFPFRDGQSCERVYQAICDITTPLTYDQAYRRVDSDLVKPHVAGD